MCKAKAIYVSLTLGLMLLFTQSHLHGEIFNFKQYLVGIPSITLGTYVQSLNTATGEVVINGGDSRQPTIPFTFDWGDGTSTHGWFPQSHTYQNRSHNYVVTVTSHYTDGSSNQASAVVYFTQPSITTIPLPSDIKVSIPDHMLSLQSRLYGLPPNLTYFDNTFFTAIRRATIEYVLTVGASIQKDFVNNNVSFLMTDLSKICFGILHL